MLGERFSALTVGATNRRAAMRVQTGALILLTLLCSCLLDLGLSSSSSTTETPSPSTTPSPASSTSSTSSATSSSATTPTTPAPTTSSSSSSSGNSRGAVVAWALFTVLIAVGLLVFLYNREQTMRKRIHHEDSLRQGLSSSDAMHSYGHQAPRSSHSPDPVMSSF